MDSRRSLPHDPNRQPTFPAALDGYANFAANFQKYQTANGSFENFGLPSIPFPEFRELAELIARNFGITINDSKITLLTGRIHPVLDKRGFANHREYINAIAADTSGHLLSELANCISTNHTAFFREEAHFAVLQDMILPDMLRTKTAENCKDLRIWCAACATGEEAYSILFTIMDFLKYNYTDWHAGLLATDISTTALNTARAGCYNWKRLEPVAPDMIDRFFKRIDAENYVVKPEVQAEVTFRRLNLISEQYPFKQPFDVIFCRNVMIYFDKEVRRALLEKFHDWLAPGGYLFIGHSEMLVGDDLAYEYIAPAVYRRCDYSPT